MMLLALLTRKGQAGKQRTKADDEVMKETPTIKQGLGTLIITGSSGRIGSSFIDRVGENYTEIGFDRKGPPHPPAETERVIACDAELG